MAALFFVVLVASENASQKEISNEIHGLQISMIFALCDADPLSNRTNAQRRNSAHRLSSEEEG